MKNKLTLKILDFEPILEGSENKLTGGFSLGYSSLMKSDYSMANNCWGGNCREGCGSWPTNSGCNEVAGCGVIKE
ncbi:hypothetical protein V1T75_09205 [Tenacibaculum sp. FZY0031]|uniref:hypothetical protein n=1 Tax=Tenacibaculum sp. FZY0031 TaxID=3116648 RepID=UPI002EB72402|nr:hypothetical protein [Tenacibaculum sp. FZY0031]